MHISRYLKRQKCSFRNVSTGRAFSIFAPTKPSQNAKEGRFFGDIEKR